MNYKKIYSIEFDSNVRKFIIMEYPLSKDYSYYINLSKFYFKSKDIAMSYAERLNIKCLDIINEMVTNDLPLNNPNKIKKYLNL